jgi:predicted  nucleic acid-binding Zn-ribbon protein
MEQYISISAKYQSMDEIHDTITNIKTDVKDAKSLEKKVRKEAVVELDKKIKELSKSVKQNKGSSEHKNVEGVVVELKKIKSLISKKKISVDTAEQRIAAAAGKICSGKALIGEMGLKKNSAQQLDDTL